MLTWLRKAALRLDYKKLELPVRVNGEALSLLAPNNEAHLVEAFIEASSRVHSSLIEELYSSFKSLSSSQGKTPEDDAQRITVLNELRAKYQELFNSLDELYLLRDMAKKGVESEDEPK